MSPDVPEKPFPTEQPVGELVESFIRNLHEDAPPAELPSARPGSPLHTLRWFHWGAGLCSGALIGLGLFALSMSLCSSVPYEAGPASPIVSRDIPPITGLLFPDEPPPYQERVGMLQFRGNPQHTFYGLGPVPHNPRLLWRFPEQPMCSESRVGDEVKEWCGTGWTGQPAIWERPDGLTEVVVGAYDRQVHFLDAHTGKPTRLPFVTGDIIKGSVSLDPDGDPLLYFGSRDNKLRVLALDRPRPIQLWAMDANLVPGIWNDDWDGNPLVHEDVLMAGGENGYFFAIRLNRDYDQNGLVGVQPELLVAYRGWTDELLRLVGDKNASIESSVAMYGNRVYFTNSAGRVVGLDIRQVKQGRVKQVFDYWVGDDVDASIVIDRLGMLYVAVELERFLPRSDQIGQLIKINPYQPDNPLVWSLAVPPAFDDYRGGIYSTPALASGMLYVTSHAGQLLVVDAASGDVLFTDDVGTHAWSSPVVVEDTLLVATCKGEIRGYTITDPRQPVLEWSLMIPSGNCIESTPVVWKGLIIVGARDGYIYAYGT